MEVLYFIFWFIGLELTCFCLFLLYRLYKLIERLIVEILNM